MVVNYHQNKGAAEKVLQEVAKVGARAVLVQADVTQQDQVEMMVRMTEQQLGPVDILVNNAYFPFQVGPLHELSWEGFHRAIEHELRRSISARVPVYRR